MISSDQVERSKAVQRHTGRTFHVATRLLPESVRYPTYVLYAFFRTADEVVDDVDPVSPDEQRRELERIRAAALGEREADDPVLAAMSDLRERHDIPREEVDVFVDSMLMDIETDRYRTHDELATYLRGSSAAVGHMMLEVMDPPQKKAARPHAAALGEAFQLTNFIRDVREDVRDYDRIYLPERSLRDHGSSHADIESLTPTEGFRSAVRDELHRTERLYQYGVAGIRYLPEDCQLPVLTAAVMYADQHRLIRNLDCDVLSTRPTLTMRRRLSLVARTWLRWRVSDDPLATFRRVTGFDAPDGFDDYREDGPPASDVRSAS
ncbi:MAG: phytoene/squalene synthase family protein [Haloplanus sp.]